MHGYFIRVTHQGLTPSSLLISDLNPRFTKPDYLLVKYPVYVPYGGYIDLPPTDEVILSFEGGGIRKLQNAGHVIATVGLGASVMASLPVTSLRLTPAVVANGTLVESVSAPINFTVDRITAYLTTAAVTAGTYTLAVMNGATTLLAGATFDLTTLVGLTVTEIPLSATPANLIVAMDDVITFTLASNNGDLTASGLVLQLSYRST